MTTPNIDLDYRAYSNNDRHFFYWIDSIATRSNPTLKRPLTESSIQQLFLWHFAAHVSPLHMDGVQERITDEQLDALFREMPYTDALNYCTIRCSPEIQRKYPGNHINWWNPGKIMEMLKAAGFGTKPISPDTDKVPKPY